jgi:hypothetical protein
MADHAVHFIINIDPHPLLGIQATIWVAPLIDDTTSLVDGRLSSGNAAGFGVDESHVLTTLVIEAEEYTEASVLAHFNKRTRVARTLTEFQSEPTRKKALSQYVQRTVSHWLERAITTGCAFSTGLHRNGIINSHLLHYLSIDEAPNLYFQRQADGIRYQLRLSRSGKPLELLGRKFQALAGTSEWAFVDRWLIRLEGAPATLLKPFTEKSEVFIPEKLVADYMRKFILPIAERADISADGFEMVEHTAISSQRLGIIQDLFTGVFKCRLAFCYDDIWFQAHEPRTSRQRLVETREGRHAIHRYQRNLTDEADLASSLVEMGLLPTGQGTCEFAHPENGATLPEAAQWLVQHAKTLAQMGWQIEPFHTPQGELMLEAAHVIDADPIEGTDWFDLLAKVEIGLHKLAFTALRQTIPNKEPFHPLPDGKCFVVPPSWFITYADWFLLGTIQDDTIRFTKAQHRALLVDQDDQKGLPAMSNGALPAPTDYAVPPSLKADLRPYQHVGFSWLAGLYGVGLGACLADDMGLGKTIQTITLLLHIREQLTPSHTEAAIGQLDIFSAVSAVQASSPLQAIIVAPSSLLYNWASELMRFAPDLRSLIHSGPNRQKNAGSFRGIDVIITSYALVVRDNDLFNKLDLQCIVLDESQHIKNKDSKTFQAVSALKSPFRLTLTGTPIENSLADLWSQMHFINPGLLGTFEKFRTNYQRPIEKQGDKEKQEALRTLVKPYLLRRRKEEVAADLPELTEQIVYCDMTEAQEACYVSERNAVRSLVLGQIEKGAALGAPLVLNALMRLRQIAICPAILPEYAEVPSGKVDVICAELETIAQSGHRALLFSAFLKHLKQYQTWLDDKKIKYDTLTGEDNSTAKHQAVEALQEEKVSFLLMTLKAGGAGLNLTAADYVLLADPWWNPAVEKQAIARAHRIGQNKPVFALRFITRGTIEEKILKLQKRKQQWSDDLLEEGAFLQHLNEQEIRELIS